jgi:PPM family protein phosphatase
MLKVVDQAFRTDTGRQRTANEDSYYARGELFAVADGMGGAQAGEVASKIAADAFESAERAGESGETYLRSIAVAANERIHRLAQDDSSHSGMGTTLTAAMVEGDEVSVAHVGDSRAYVYRDGELRLLTSDHSLVEELRRQGRLTDEQAEGHPQRSIITRALGPEADVDIDTLTFSARPGDVFLICSDGLTTMVTDERIAELLSSSRDLDEAADRLVAEANEAGGRDNITVVAFRLEEADEAAAAEDATLIGPSAEEAGLSAEGVRAGTMERARRGEHPPPARRRRLKTAAKVLAVLLIVAGLGAAAVYGARQVYFLGVDDGGRIALYRGLPYDLPFDVSLYSEVYSVPVQAASLPEDRRDSLTDHELRSRDDADSLIDDLESAAIAPLPAPPQDAAAGGGASQQGQQGGGAGGAEGGSAGGGQRSGGGQRARGQRQGSGNGGR